MTHNKITIALESPALSAETKSEVQEKFVSLQKRISLPESLVAELAAYMARNNIVINNGRGNTKVEHCQQCFKAHVLTEASNHGLDQQSIMALKNIINGKTGHDGYYLDGNDLRELSITLIEKKPQLTAVDG
ncbi:MAG TPA: hypothetical protein VJK03_03245 [Candidatus Nanoarchaeia archaeon]|nr:hypothetical protein [Candidatus Nanoarchaeia archaeon]